MQCPSQTSNAHQVPLKPSEGVQHPPGRGHSALIWAWGVGLGQPLICCHLPPPPRSQLSRGCKGAAEQGAAVSYLLPLPKASKPSARHSRPLPKSLRAGQAAPSESRQQAGVTAGAAVTPLGRPCTLRQRLPACLPGCPRPRGNPAAGRPSSQPPSAMLWDRENGLERVKACIILHVKSLFLGACQTGSAEDEAGRRTRDWHLNMEGSQQSLPSPACRLPCCKRRPSPGRGRAALPAGVTEGTMLLTCPYAVADPRLSHISQRQRRQGDSPVPLGQKK